MLSSVLSRSLSECWLPFVKERVHPFLAVLAREKETFGQCLIVQANARSIAIAEVASSNLSGLNPT